MPLVCATALPSIGPTFAADRLKEFCRHWERKASPRLTPSQRAHLRLFAHNGAALYALASRLLVRLLALRVLPQNAVLDMDALGRPCVIGATGWHISFSHSGRAAFCLVIPPSEMALSRCGNAALDAESLAIFRPAEQIFGWPARSFRMAVRRWTLAESLFKALGANPCHWEAITGFCRQFGQQRAGIWSATDGCSLSWRLLSLPGHSLCVALAGEQIPFPGLRWLSWRELI